MYSDQSLKGLKETPMFFGVRGRYVMIMVASMIVASLLLVCGMVLFFFAKKIAIGFLILAFWFIEMFLIFSFFRWISIEKDFKKIKKRPEIITNKDLNDYL
ncbi:MULTISPECIES: hypothetical protein [unclassified Chryseobacterium]|uniref:hypothetical protein n=1 Tax=unclassified Chryseobacterium TaxID=2593645 RepID=UPI0030183D9C